MAIVARVSFVVRVRIARIVLSPGLPRRGAGGGRRGEIALLTARRRRRGLRLRVVLGRRVGAALREGGRGVEVPGVSRRQRGFGVSRRLLGRVAEGLRAPRRRACVVRRGRGGAEGSRKASRRGLRIARVRRRPRSRCWRRGGRVAC